MRHQLSIKMPFKVAVTASDGSMVSLWGEGGGAPTSSESEAPPYCLAKFWSQKAVILIPCLLTTSTEFLNMLQY